MKDFDDIEKETLKIIDRLPVLPKYDKEIMGLLAEEGEFSRLLRVSGPGIRFLDVRGVVQELKGQRRRWAITKDPDYNDFSRIKDAPTELNGRYSSPVAAFDAIEKFLATESVGRRIEDAKEGNDK